MYMYCFVWLQFNFYNGPINKACIFHFQPLLFQEIQELKAALAEERERSGVIWDQLKACGENFTESEELMVEEEEEQREELVDVDNPIIPRVKSTGMFEYDKGEEGKLLKVLITDLSPSLAAEYVPGLPACVLFMLIRYLDHINDSTRIRDLIEGGISHIKKTVRKFGQKDIELKALWLSNTVKLLHCLKQYSGEPRFQLESSSKQKEQCLRNFDLSAYWKALSDIACWIYHGVTEMIAEQLQPSMVIALLEHEGIKGLGGDTLRPQIQGRVASKDTHLDPRLALECLLIQLTSYHHMFLKQGLEKEIICQIFRQIFYFLCAGGLNNLLLRKDLCHWSRGMQIRYNVAQLEQWAQDQGLEETGYRVTDTLAPIIQAAILLQAKKSVQNVQQICDMCTNLRVSQIVKILNLYTPGDEFEDRVSPLFVRKIQETLQERAELEDKNAIPLLLDTKYIFYFRFHFKPSNIDFTELEAEDLYSNLPNMVRKI